MLASTTFSRRSRVRSNRWMFTGLPSIARAREAGQSAPCGLAYENYHAHSFICWKNLWTYARTAGCTGYVRGLDRAVGLCKLVQYMFLRSRSWVPPFS
jgi:hypothetical protein